MNNIICTLVGHKATAYASRERYLPRVQYAPVKGNIIDATGKINARVEGPCARCGAEFMMARIRVPVPVSIENAINLIVKYGGTDGDRHKDWVMDQVVRELAGSRYDAIVKNAKSGAAGPDSYEWDVGIAP